MIHECRMYMTLAGSCKLLYIFHKILLRESINSSSSMLHCFLKCTRFLNGLWILVFLVGDIGLVLVLLDTLVGLQDANRSVRDVSIASCFPSVCISFSGY